ncbi:MAG: ABC transporter permease [Bacteroidales bacterium]
MKSKYNPWKALWTIGKREYKRWVSHPIYLFCMIGIPMICTLFFLSLMSKGLPSDLPIALVDMNNTATSRNLARQLDAFSQTKIVMRTCDFQAARMEMQKGSIYGIFYIPKNFSQDAISGREPILSFYTNGTYLIAASLLFRDMKTISVLASKSVGLQTGLAKGKTESSLMAQLQPIEIETHALGNPWLNYSVYLSNTLLPGILQLVILMITVLSIGSEIKERSARQWLEKTELNLPLALFAKLWPQTLVFMLMGLMMQSALFGWFSFPLQSGWGPMILALFCFVVATEAVGVFMIGVLPTLRLGLSFACLFGMLAFSITGFSFPVSAMHPILQSAANWFPLRHYFLIYVDQALNGRALFYSLTEYAFLLAFLVLPLFVLRNLKNALLNFRYIP